MLKIFFNRLKSPFGGAFILSWILTNWELIFKLFNFDTNINLETKVNIIHDYINHSNLWNFAFGPFIYSILAIIVSQFGANLSKLIITFFERKVLPYILKIDSKKIIDKQRFDAINKSFDLSIAEQYKLEQNNESLKNNVSSLQKMIDDLNSKIMNTKIITNNKEWLAYSKKESPQNADLVDIDLNNKLLQEVRCNLLMINSYFRFGFKIGSKDSRMIGDAVLTDGNNFLFHIAKNVDDENLYLTCYQNKTQIENKSLGKAIIGEKINFILSIHDRNKITLFLRSSGVFETTVNYDARERLALISWGDSYEYELQVTEIEVKTIG